MVLDSGLVMQPQALVEQDSITLSHLQAIVQAQGHQGGNIIREFDDGMRLTLQRPLQDATSTIPKTSVCPEPRSSCGATSA